MRFLLSIDRSEQFLISTLSGHQGAKTADRTMIWRYLIYTHPTEIAKRQTVIDTVLQFIVAQSIPGR